MKYEIVARILTHPGLQRPTNQDAGLFVRPHDPAVFASKGVLLVAADGMGGHSGGEVASRLAVETVRRVYYDAREEPEQALRAALACANQEIYGLAQRDERLMGMGTTCTALALQNGSAVCAHVGDSRLYLIRNGQIYVMTEDDSAVRQMVAQGLLSVAESRRHADGNLLLRALGTRPEVEIGGWESPFPVLADDRFVLCSDGLHNLVEDDEIREAVVETSPEEAGERLLALALERGGQDNITVAVLGIRRHELRVNVPETRETRIPS